jgi:hypothetical protein
MALAKESLLPSTREPNMLLLASRTIEHELNDEGRLSLLKDLQEREFIPLIRSTRFACYEQALADMSQVKEMERLVAAASGSSEGQAPYVHGDIFCFEDHIFFLLFGDEAYSSSAKMRAGIVYEPQTAEPLRKLNSFCQTISLCLAGAKSHLLESVEDEETKLTPWRPDSAAAVHQGFMRFVAKQDADSLSTIACRENARERVRAAKLLEESGTRSFLRHAKEAFDEGYPLTPSSAQTEAAVSEFSVDKLLEAGLMRREVLISCRRSGHTLFSLPSADALAVITISQARCSVCGAPIADEKVEEVLAPTQFSSILLTDGAWLVNRLHAILREQGISESEIAVEPPAGDGEARMMARVCGEQFLIVMRDGDLTPAFARRAVNTKIETESPHLLIVVTGKIHNEGRTILQNFAQRLARGGNDFELMIADGTAAAERELRRAFERVSQKALAEQLCELDASLGLSVPHLITTRFQLLNNPQYSDKRIARLTAPQDTDLRLREREQIVSVSDF